MLTVRAFGTCMNIHSCRCWWKYHWYKGTSWHVDHKSVLFIDGISGNTCHHSKIVGVKDCHLRVVHKAPGVFSCNFSTLRSE